jgi:hypothetical protein
MPNLHVFHPVGLLTKIASFERLNAVSLTLKPERLDLA